MAKLRTETRTDQAAGLRRLMASPLPGLCTVLSADDVAQKDALMQRLASSMCRRGREVILVDSAATPPASGDTRDAGDAVHTLLDVAHGHAALAEAGCEAAGGYRCVKLGARRDDPALADLLRQLAAQKARVLVDATLDAEGRLPLPLLADGEIVVQLSGSEASIRTAYELLRALKDQCAHGSVSLLVTAADPAHARRVHSNLFHAASRYLALSVRSIVAQETHHV